MEAKENGKTIKNICIFCGSSPGKKEVYKIETQKLGEAMLKRKYNLVYGGGTVGVMGFLANTIHAGGGEVTGVIPESLSPKEISGHSLGKVIIVKDMHQRKLTMYKSSDAFIALPGGFGTFEELFEIITWQQLGIHNKPIGLLNIDGYYEPLLKMIQHSSHEGFISEELAKNVLVVSSDPDDLLEKLSKHIPPKSSIKWMDESMV